MGKQTLWGDDVPYIYLAYLTVDSKQEPESVVWEVWWTTCHRYAAVKLRKIWTPEKIGLIILKFEQCGFMTEYCTRKMQMEWNGR